MSRIQQKLTDNALLRKHEEMLSGFNGDLKRQLTNAECILSDQINQLVEGWHWATPVLGKADCSTKPRGWAHHECDNLAALGRMAGLVKMPSVDGYLWLGREMPVLVVNCGIWNNCAWHLMNYVGECANVCLALVAADNSAGLLISEYIGSLPKPMRTNNNEIVYELVSW